MGELKHVVSSSLRDFTDHVVVNLAKRMQETPKDMPHLDFKKLPELCFQAPSTMMALPPLGGGMHEEQELHCSIPGTSRTGLSHPIRSCPVAPVQL